MLDLELPHLRKLELRLSTIAYRITNRMLYVHVIPPSPQKDGIVVLIGEHMSITDRVGLIWKDTPAISQLCCHSSCELNDALGMLSRRKLKEVTSQLESTTEQLAQEYNKRRAK